MPKTHAIFCVFNCRVCISEEIFLQLFVGIFRLKDLSERRNNITYKCYGTDYVYFWHKIYIFRNIPILITDIRSLGAFHHIIRTSYPGYLLESSSIGHLNISIEMFRHSIKSSQDNDLLSISDMLKYLWMAWLFQKVPMDNPFLITDMGALGAICYLNGIFRCT